MGTQEWLLLGLVLVVPLIVAIAVTLWTLEQALKRNRKNRKDQAARRVSEPVVETGAMATSASGSGASRDRVDDSPLEPAADANPVTVAGSSDVDAGGGGGTASD